MYVVLFRIVNPLRLMYYPVLLTLLCLSCYLVLLNLCVYCVILYCKPSVAIVLSCIVNPLWLLCYPELLTLCGCHIIVLVFLCVITSVNILQKLSALCLLTIQTHSLNTYNTSLASEVFNFS